MGCSEYDVELSRSRTSTLPDLWRRIVTVQCLSSYKSLHSLPLIDTQGTLRQLASFVDGRRPQVILCNVVRHAIHRAT